MKKSIILVTLLTILLTIVGCGSGEPSVYDAPDGAPYAGLYEVDHMNSSCSYTYSKGVNTFKVTMKWRTENENIDYAEFTDEYYLEWASEEGLFREICEPVNDMSSLKNKTYVIKPGEDVEISFDVDSYFDNLPQGYYTFVKVLNVVNKDGSSQKMVATFGFDLND